VLADRIGFDNLWFVEHHFLTGFSGSPCPEVLLGALSQMTRRIRIGFGVSILPAHHPIHVAERAAMLDQLTDGRLEVGTGRSNAYEQLGQGIDPRDTRAMWEESITMLPRIWQSDEFSWEGISLDSGPGAARAAFGQMDPDTLCERGIIIAGDPDSCVRGVRLYEEAGVDEVILIMQTETIPHEQALSSIEMFGKHVIPACRADKGTRPTPARA
jgi:alkanesulfonate monooxygenase SsuD/methylene tetrahydromethanopterin reductase-like flavin-dependent oxidoreductase (luciferase family)